ncbi:unannotated protein [freshwater metagenome]|uniref:Unannotated protein n=1 Tax=freshwater metagenome TaxID=449393 RepID=A0A6J7EJJ9_9ZZZZ
MCVLGRLGEQVELRAQPRANRHHDGLADRVDRRVGHLREELLEVTEQRRTTIGEDGERVVVPHRADRLLAGARHRRHENTQVLLRVTESKPPLVTGEHPGERHVSRLQIGELDAVVAEPLSVGPQRGDLALDLLVIDDASLLKIDEEDLPRLQAPESDDVLRLDREHSGLRAENHVAVGRLNPAPRAQAVAVKCRPDDPAVGEADRCGPVPRLHQAGVEGVEALELIAEVVPALVGLGDHHHRRVWQRAAREHQQL